MKNNFLIYIVVFSGLLLFILSGCKKEADKVNHIVINDYLPLKVGAKYKYYYWESYWYVYESSTKHGECTWRFTSVSAGTPVVYQVEQSFTGDSVYIYDLGSPFPIQKDSTHIENRISTLNFVVQHNGKVAFPGNGGITLERFIQSDKNDTCFRSSPLEQVCLRKDVGITSLYLVPMHGNHQLSEGYSLIEGPYY